MMRFERGLEPPNLLLRTTDPDTLTISDRWLTRDGPQEHVRSAEYRLLLARHLGGLDLMQAPRAPALVMRKADRT
jgi:hypothetical protein